MKKIYALLLLFFVFATVTNAQVVGDTGVCKGDIEVYNVPVLAGASYAWNITGGTILGPSNVDSATIQWNMVGTGTIIVTRYNPSGPPTYYTLNVFVHPKPEPVISHVPYPGCPRDTGRANGGTGNSPEHQNCDKVCKFATVVYSTPLHPLSTYVWVATGASTVVNGNTNSPTVTWNGTLYGTLVVYETNQYGCTDSGAICIEKVDLPVANFTHLASVCRNANTLFTNTSTGATSYQWSFGDGSTSTSVNPTHIYTTAGSYTVTLIAINDCHCTDTITSVINVDALPGPTISCPATVCANATATYTTSSSAGCIYTWFATGGTITAGQGTPAVTVLWGPGQLGTLGLYISGCAAVCTDTTIIQIPIVPATAVITGENKVCAGDCEYYSLPHFSGATYHWSLGSTCGLLVDSNCCEQVRICWGANLYSCTDTLKVSYYDSFLQCGGQAIKIIRLRPRLSIFGNTITCANGITNYTASGGVVCTWNISPSGPTYLPGPSSSLSVNWNGLVGNYTITATPVGLGQVCNDFATVLVKVIAPPSAPVITGDTIVCPNSQVVYCSMGAGAVNWLVTGGTPLSSIGNCITVSWGPTGPHSISAFEQMAGSPFCSSDTTVQNVYQSLAGAPVLTGPSPACANSTNTYATTTLYPSGTTFTWSISPSNAGAIQSPGSASTQIEWGNNAPQNVTVTLSVNLCGTPLTNTLVVALKPIPTPTVTQIGNLCTGGSAQLNVATGPFTAVTWSGPGGYTSAGNPNANILVDGLYQVTVTAGGCSGSSQYKVTYVSGPTANISTADPVTYCNGTTFSVNLCALGNPSYSYVWSNAAVTQCTAVATPGSYSALVTDASTGCTATSNVINVSQGPCIPTSCSPNAAFTVSFTHNTCNPMTFTNTSVGASSFAWNFGDLNTSIVTSPTHTYAQAGFYLVILEGAVPNTAGTGFCRLQDTAHIEIPLAAKFDIVSGCNGTPVCFTDRSTYTAGNAITSWAWNFGDAGTSTLQSPCHTYAGPGTYTVTLTITNGVCSQTITNTVTIAGPPVAAFNFVSPNCINNAVSFIDASTGGVNYWNWAFGDGGTSLNQNPTHSFTPATTYPVTLIVHDQYGCLDTVIKPITISSPSISGNITATDTVVCAGTPVVLTAPTCITCTYLWNTGATANTITVTATGIYSVTMNDGNGCPYSTFIRIIVNSGPPAIILNNGSNEICLGGSITLFTAQNVNWLYNWITNDGLNNGSTNYIIGFYPVVAGVYTYQLAITDTSTGCSDTSLPYVVNVHTPPIPPTIIGVGPTTICKGDTALLVGSHPDPTVDLEWNTGTLGDSVYVTENGCFQLLATDTNGCKSTASYCVTVNPAPDVCMFYEGCLDTCRPYTIHGPYGNTGYQWQLNGVNISGANAIDYVANVSGIYSVIVTNGFGCIDTTGDLNLSLHDCDTMMCATFYIDSVKCDSAKNHVVYYHVVNLSNITLTQVNIEMLAPYLNLPYAPNVIFTSIAAGDTSGQLSTTIVGGTPLDTICFRVHIATFDTMGHELLCCYSDTQCVRLPQCDTVCCRFRYVGQTYTCEQTPAGPKYNFSVQIDACGGSLIVQSPSPGILNVTNPYTIINGVNTINGSYIANPNDSVLCLTYILTNNAGSICKDTTICFPIKCGQHPLPCQWDYNKYVCEGGTTFFGYYGNPVGLTINWSFPGGVPSSATGAGPHNVTYPTAGTYPFTMTLTNANGTTTCTDSITVVAKPTATVTQVGNALNASPSGMYYQWYLGNPTGTGIAGATNQFLNANASGFYCVVVTNANGCSDTACHDLKYTGIEELNTGTWTIFPNPNEGTFTLALNMTANDHVEMKIVNALGEVIDLRVFDAKTGSQNFYISNKNFASGIYFIQLKNDNGISTKRMMVR